MKITSVLALSTCLAWASLLAACPGAQGDEGEGEEGEEGEGEGEGEGGPCGTDDVLGSFALGAGFAIVDSASVTGDVAFVGVSDFAGERRLIAMRQDIKVVDFGVWPDLDATPTVLFDALADADRALSPDAFEVFPQFLHVDRALIASAYTRASDFSGEIGGHNLETDNTNYLAATGPYAATTIGDSLVVNAGGIGDVVEGAGVYAITGGDVVHVASLADDALVGEIAVTADGILVIEQYVDANQLIALGPDDVGIALGGGTIDVGAVAPFVDGGVSSIAAQGSGVSFVVVDDDFNTLGVRFIALATDGIAVTPAAPADVLTSANTCTRITTIASFDDDILVGLTDERGLRLVRIHKG